VTTVSERYGPEAQLPCACGAWYGPTSASHEAHKAVFGHWPTPPKPATRKGGERRERTDPEPDEGADLPA
jgi:hypothetical protein